MALLKYFKNELPSKFQTNKHLTVADIESANKKVKVEIDKLNAQPTEKRRRITYATYTSKDRAAIGKYAAEHGPMATSRYLRRN